ncbi:MAG: preprotein translocase subunit SecG [Glaciimonas sp.]|nr:preprotein translocase subunit SecG [Glaciimonas sp.]
MQSLFTTIVVVQILSALAIIALVLLQHGKGADMGAAFGSGASGSLFGASGSSNFLSRSTGLAAVIFFSATLALAYFGNKGSLKTGGVMDTLPATSIPAPSSSSVPTPSPAAAPVPPAPASGSAGQIPK